ncbi:Cytoplasmic dynein 1 light intermediate chain 1 [Smittium mucronatum]|uniref:Cytoplasmic dynein 1 light intermediate chain 1 n=1 Tax=Smittium mucronatum TaxID=133383 RepID=A0A1R0GTW8_9FUNG|nr:Cytoplasmic dynein 1 light intermediate chain 1 [Smittium mucronatum]
MDPPTTKNQEGENKPPINLWKQVLADATTKKSIKTKNLIIMGDENSGKSSLVAQFLKFSQKPGVGNGLDAKSPTFNSSENSNDFENLRELIEAGKNDIGLSYISTDVLDEDSEDWSRPYRFIKSLLRWLDVLKEAVENVRSDSLGRQRFILATEEIERYLQLYTDPEGDSPKVSEHGNSAPKNTASSYEVLLPLESGVLESNLGIPIIIVCTKSDVMAQLERESMFKEEIFDYIQQTLRSICLQYGAALFYTSQAHPMTYSELRHYIIHRLLSRKFAELQAKDSEENDANDQESDPTSKKMSRENISIEKDTTDGLEKESDHEYLSLNYPFRLSAQILERDTVRVPSGWDTKAKIDFLRDGFNVESCMNSFSLDTERYRKFVAIMLKKYSESSTNLRYNLEKVVLEAQKNADSMRDTKSHQNSDESFSQEELPSLLRNFMSMIGQGSYIRNANINFNGELDIEGNTPVLYENEQEFLNRLYLEQEDRMNIEESVKSSRRMERTVSRPIDENSPYHNSQSRYKISENILSTAAAPMEEMKFSIEKNENENLFSDSGDFDTNGSTEGSKASRSVRMEIDPVKGAPRDKVSQGNKDEEESSQFDKVKLESFFTGLLLKKKGNIGSTNSPNSELLEDP